MYAPDGGGGKHPAGGSGLGEKSGIKEVDLGAGHLLELEAADPRDDVALDVGLIGGIGGGPDGGSDGRQPFRAQEVRKECLRRFDVKPGGESPEDLGELIFRFALALVSGMELLPALDAIL
jgi:hypothetical protein